MNDKYQVLVDSNKRHCIIEKTENANGKDYWSVYIPDAGDRNSAVRVSRLLNEEYDRDQSRRSGRAS